MFVFPSLANFHFPSVWVALKQIETLLKRTAEGRGRQKSHFRFATAVLLPFTTWKQAVWGCEENVSIFILLSWSKLLYKNFPFAAQTCQELGTRLSPVLGHRIWPTRYFRGYDQKEFKAMNFATLLPNSVANSQLVSAVLRYDITVQFNVLKIKWTTFDQFEFILSFY